MVTGSFRQNILKDKLNFFKIREVEFRQSIKFLCLIMIK